jgi:hypothetical protein
MLSKIKLAPKLIGGFVIVAAIAAIIGIVGYRSVGELADVRMPSIVGLNKIDVATITECKSAKNAG